jgi:hypothetical protein
VKLDFVVFLEIGLVQLVAKPLDNLQELVIAKINVGAVKTPSHLLTSGSCCHPDVP